MEIVFAIVFAAHLLAVNLGSAGPFICIGLHVCHFRNGTPSTGDVGKRLAVASVWATTVGILLGLVMLGLLWQMNDRPYFQALAKIPVMKYCYAVAELGFYYVCMFAYVRLWDVLRNHPVWHGCIGLAAATNLLYHFPPLMAMIATLQRQPAIAADELANPAYVHALLWAPEVTSRVVHAWMASLAVAGVALMGYAVRISTDHNDRTSVLRLAVWGARIALSATLLQWGLGIWVLLQLPPSTRDALMGGDAWGTALLGAGLAATLALMHNLTAVALGDTSPQHIVRCLLWMILVVALMAGTLRRAQFVSTPTDPPRSAARTSSMDSPPALPYSNRLLPNRERNSQLCRGFSGS